MKRSVVCLAQFAALVAAACAGPDSDPAALPVSMERLGPAHYPVDNPASEPKRLLGRLLFYDPILSADRATSCVTCHSEIWGLGDQLPRSVGVEGRGAIGPGRTGSHMTRRNAPALWNLAQRSEFFWDGRAGTLEAQVFFPLENPDELARDPDALIADLAGIDMYVGLFREAFPDEAEPVTRDSFARALATFVRAYASDHAPYDQYLAGDALALDAQDQRGLRLFGELGCQACHVPPRFDSDRYDNRVVPNPEAILDEGRYEITGEERDRGAFRVPTLRNARETGPYFHNGAVPDFDAAIRHEVDLQVQLGLRAALSSAEFEDLSKFLRRALTDTSHEQHPPAELPSGLSLPLDGDRLLRGGT